RGDVDVGRAEGFAEQERPGRDRVLERIECLLVRAVTDHARLRRSGPLEQPVDDRGLDAAGGEEEPAIVLAAGGRVGRRREPGRRKRVGKVRTDRGRLRHDRAAVDDRGDLAHRIDAQKIRRLVLAALEVEQPHLVRRADLLEHPVDDSPAGHRVVVENEFVAHAGSPDRPSKYVDSRRAGRPTYTPLETCRRRSRSGGVMKPASLAVLAAALAAFAAFAQPPPGEPPQRFRGVLEQVDGDRLTVATEGDGSITVVLTPETGINGLERRSLEDIVEGVFIGTTAARNAEGRWQATEVHIFPEEMRGAGE